MTATVKVSLLIPSFNNADTVYAAIRSCMLQTYRDIEILVYDEASSDGTREILYNAAQEDARIRIMTSDTNSGPVLAWRRLLAEARGEYFTFVWSDDLLMPRYVEKLLPVLEANPAQLLTGCNAIIEPVSADWEQTLLVSDNSKKPSYNFQSMKMSGDVYALGLMTGFLPFTQICSLYRTFEAKKVFDGYINFENPYKFDYSRRAYGNEVAYLSELACLSGEVCVTGEALVILRASKGSMTVNAIASHKYDFWLQYVWAIMSSWKKCQSLSPRMDILVKVATDRLHLCDTVAAIANKRCPRYFNPLRIVRALLFAVRFDARVRHGVQLQSLVTWMARRKAV